MQKLWGNIRQLSPGPASSSAHGETAAVRPPLASAVPVRRGVERSSSKRPPTPSQEPMTYFSYANYIRSPRSREQLLAGATFIDEGRPDLRAPLLPFDRANAAAS